MATFHDLTMKSITGDPVAFSAYKGNVCLIVNLASR
jgi:glutathione peroxidase-family protein